MNDFLTKLLAQLFASFKAKNPKVAAVLILILVTVVNFADQGSLIGLFTLPDWAAASVKWLGLIILGISGSQTYQYLDNNAKNG